MYIYIYFFFYWDKEKDTKIFVDVGTKLRVDELREAAASYRDSPHIRRYQKVKI